MSDGMQIASCGFQRQQVREKEFVYPWKPGKVAVPRAARRKRPLGENRLHSTVARHHLGVLRDSKFI